ncbi:Crp/Fnr family transcriptional regulator [Nonomuraea soli]|uniref:CRP-like cAMP-binding protein n=1 Tax=Nonomuraea soli TaxID=1032476 RepID=A0A7W0CHI6_9ACTN|nr:Crp/Fnr family transcriptional regulator [Nonomuraea soli]MBA2891306.1 CRP-like cAMP-binding protein [Nonomuraea soli]
MDGEWPPGSLLGRLATADRSALLGLGTVVRYQAEEQLLVEGDTGTHVLLLREGVVKITAGDQSALLAIRVRGDLIGELSAVDPSPRIATATATGPVLANRISSRDFRVFLAARPEASLAVSGVIGAKLRSATRRRIDFSGHDVQSRLARVVVELIDLYGRQVKEGVEITVALTQQELAGIIGAKEPSVHRALAVLRRDGLIETRYRNLVVRDEKELRRIANISVI